MFKVSVTHELLLGTPDQVAQLAALVQASNANNAARLSTPDPNADMTDVKVTLE